MFHVHRRLAESGSFQITFAGGCDASQPPASNGAVRPNRRISVPIFLFLGLQRQRIRLHSEWADKLNITGKRTLNLFGLSP